MSPYLMALIWFIAMIAIITICKIWKKIVYRIKFPELYKRKKGC